MSYESKKISNFCCLCDKQTVQRIDFSNSEEGEFVISILCLECDDWVMFKEFKYLN